MPEAAPENAAPQKAAPQKTEERSAAFRLATFGAALVVVLFAGYGIGRLNNSVEAAATPPQPQMTDMSGMSHDDAGQPAHVHNADGTVSQAAAVAPATGESVGGLALTASGLTMVPETATLQAGKKQKFSFRITGAGGAPITTYAVVHDKPLHFVVIRRDLTGFQHLHPTMAPDGTWSIDLPPAEPGSYRAIADFTAIVGGRQTPVALGVDLTVAGNYVPVPLPAPVTEATAGTFTVSYAGSPQIGSTQPLLLTVRDQAGKSAALEPYLGAFGHLVVLREGDVGYVHVHPEPQLADGAVKFWLAAPGPGRYRMFFDFQVAGQVHTAAYTVVVGS
ncbi:hypothetical protein [Winogradskya humida]|uniref:Secreted protein n=1 Tax=Winogradskya humida TaxID=113566 RepID=A0ABQ3ZL88_9ACTN|nr:hypothetical protein [Actinoplanes humidus]GIE19259.1 hypothetical protein Ahu01nite_023610 [Actinoplanes humidus]